MIDNDCCNHLGTSSDTYGHVVPRSQPFLKCNYLERHGDAKKGVVYKQSKREVFIYKESIVYPLVDMDTCYSNKEDLFF